MGLSIMQKMHITRAGFQTRPRIEVAPCLAAREVSFDSHIHRSVGGLQRAKKRLIPFSPRTLTTFRPR